MIHGTYTTYKLSVVDQDGSLVIDSTQVNHRKREKKKNLHKGINIKFNCFKHI